MENTDNKKFWFFGSKLNTFLLLVLIILMIIAIKIMLRNESVYFPSMASDSAESPVEPTAPPTAAATTPTSIKGQASATPTMLGNTADLVSFSIKPGADVTGIVPFTGVINNSYFFEGNIVINVLSASKEVLQKSSAKATTDWTTSGNVSFAGSINFSTVAKGPAYVEIHNDNASGDPANDKSILVPVVIQ